MLKRCCLSFFVLLLPVAVWCGGVSPEPENNSVMADREQMTPRQLLDMAESYYEKAAIDTALIYYDMVTATPQQEGDTEQLKMVVEAYNKEAVIYFHMGDYRRSYESLISALPLAEKCNYVEYETLLYTNIGNINFRFNEYETAKEYYLKALGLHRDSTVIVALYNNLGAVEAELGQTDSAFRYLNGALQISGRNRDVYKYSILNTVASLYQKERQYDSAFYYYRSALMEAKKQNSKEDEAETLSNLGNLWFERNRPDSARCYIESSIAVAVDNKFMPTLTENYHILSKIEKAGGNSSRSLEYFEQYASLKDSILNAKNFGDINQLQRMYEVSKINRQVEQLTIERQFREQTIFYHRVIQAVTLSLLLVVSVVLLIVFRQKRKLNSAYKTLFEKNLEIIDFRGSREKQPEKHKRVLPQESTPDDLLNRIMAVMEETDVICDPKFSINMLAGLVQANHHYVSHEINTKLRKNFRTFLNGYRIREAQRLFAEPDSAKYTIESVSLRVGFKSRSTFREAFKEVTGISPNIYLNYMQENKNWLNLTESNREE